MYRFFRFLKNFVICRIGSLEIKRGRWEEAARVICRIGSLETDMHDKDWSFQVICRIGSLETLNINAAALIRRYLPYRQFRNFTLHHLKTVFLLSAV